MKGRINVAEPESIRSDFFVFCAPGTSCRPDKAVVFRGALLELNPFAHLDSASMPPGAAPSLCRASCATRPRRNCRWQFRSARETVSSIKSAKLAVASPRPLSRGPTPIEGNTPKHFRPLPHSSNATAGENRFLNSGAPSHSGSCPRSGAAPARAESRVVRSSPREIASRSPAVALGDRLHQTQKARTLVRPSLFSLSLVEPVGVEPTSESNPPPESTCLARVFD